MSKEKIVLLLILNAILIIGCKNTDKVIRPHYCYQGKSDVMDLIFKFRNDSGYLSYVYSMDSGKYLNANWQQEGYAASFSLNDVNNVDIPLRILNYRDSQFYNVRLILKDNGLGIQWKASQGNIPFLPSDVLLKECID